MLHKSYSLSLSISEVIQYLDIIWPPFSCDYIVWSSWSFIFRAGGKRSDQMCWRLRLCQAEGTDQIMSSLAGLCPVETTARSRRSALAVTVTASGPSWARWAQDGSSHTFGQSQYLSQLIWKTEKSNGLLVFVDVFFCFRINMVGKSKRESKCCMCWNRAGRWDLLLTYYILFLFIWILHSSFFSPHLS